MRALDFLELELPVTVSANTKTRPLGRTAYSLNLWPVSLAPAVLFTVVSIVLSGGYQCLVIPFDSAPWSARGSLKPVPGL